MDKGYYICHYCCEYISLAKYDMTRHFNRKNKCKCFSLYSYECAEKLSLTKKFYFHMDMDKLIHDDYIFIMNNYNLPKNDIYEDFRKNVPKQDFDIKSTIMSLIPVNNEIIVKKSEDDNIMNNKELFDKIFFEEENKRYVCKKCGCGYTSKQNLIKHLRMKKECVRRSEINELINDNLQIAEIKKDKIKKEDEKFKSHVVQNNISNVQNNIQNNNNTQNTTYNIMLKDFIHENYDLTHIKDSFYEKKDFFIYSNFLRMVMENEKNQNIFFSNNEAIVYSDNELNKMSSDKAGYLVLDKLSQSFNQLLNMQDDGAREYYSFITKYYSLLKGQYKHDTIYKDYDIDEKKFVYTSNSNMFRSRDKYLSKIMTTVNKFSNDAREHMNVKAEDIRDIPLINPSIEDFASVRMRYRDLKN